MAVYPFQISVDCTAFEFPDRRATLVCEIKSEIKSVKEAHTKTLNTFNKTWGDTVTAFLHTSFSGAIWSHDGPRRAHQTAIECFGRKLGHIGGHMGITGREGGSPDGTFPWKKWHSWCWHDAGMKKIEEGLTKVNGKPYLRTRFVISNARFPLGKWHVFQNSYPCVGKTDDFVQGRHEQKSDLFQHLSLFQWEKVYLLRWAPRRKKLVLKKMF